MSCSKIQQDLQPIQTTWLYFARRILISFRNFLCIIFILKNFCIYGTINQGISIWGSNWDFHPNIQARIFYQSVFLYDHGIVVLKILFFRVCDQNLYGHVFLDLQTFSQDDFVQNWRPIHPLSLVSLKSKQDRRDRNRPWLKNQFESEYFFHPFPEYQTHFHVKSLKQ